MMRREITAVMAIVGLMAPGCMPYRQARVSPSQKIESALLDYIRNVQRISYENKSTADVPAEVAARKRLHEENPEVAEMARHVEAGTADTDTRVRLASTYLNEGVYFSALPIYQELRENPGTAGTAELGLARIWLDWGQLKPAVEHAETAVRMMPDSHEACDVLGRIYLRLGRPADAIAAWSEAAARLPEALGPDATIEANIGYAYLVEEEWSQAAMHLERAIALGADTERTHNNLGIALARMGDHEGALSHFTAVNEPAAAYNNLGVVYMAQKDWSRAAAAFESALAADPDYERARRNLARAWSYTHPPAVVNLHFTGGSSHPLASTGLVEVGLGHHALPPALLRMQELTGVPLHLEARSYTGATARLVEGEFAGEVRDAGAGSEGQAPSKPLEHDMGMLAGKAEPENNPTASNGIDPAPRTETAGRNWMREANAGMLLDKLPAIVVLPYELAAGLLAMLSILLAGLVATAAARARNRRDALRPLNTP